MGLVEFMEGRVQLSTVEYHLYGPAVLLLCHAATLEALPYGLSW